MKKNKIWYWVLAECTDELGFICIYSRTFVTLEEAEEAYNIQVKKGRVARLYRRGLGRGSSGYGFKEVLKRNF